MDISNKTFESADLAGLSRIFDDLPYGCILVDEAGSIRLVNRGAEALFDLRRDDAVGMQLEGLVSSRIEPMIIEAADLRDRVRKAQKEQRDIPPLELRVQIPSRGIRRLEYESRLIRPGGPCSFRIDTYRPLGGEEFAIDPRTLRSILQDAPYGLALIEADGSCSHVNNTFTGMTGYTQSDLPSLDAWLAKAHPNPSYRKIAADLWRETVIGQAAPASFSVVCGDGRVREMEVRPTMLPGGRMVLAFHDITARVGAEEALRQATSELEAVIDAFPDLYLRLNFDGTVISCRGGQTSHLPVPAHELLGRKIQEVLSGAIGQQVKDALLQAHAGPHPASLEFSFMQPGGMRSCEARVVPLPERQALVIVRDITEKKRAEREIAAQLKEKEVLLKEVHHRVKNNLQLISSLLALQSRYADDETARDAFRDCQHRIRSLGFIHEKLYRSESLARIDFGGYIRELAESLLHSYGIQPDQVRLRIRADDLLLGIDEAIPCGLIVNELVSNAMKHAFPDGRRGTITINLRKDEAGGITLEVSDDGVGFPDKIEIASAESLGLQLVSSLAEQLRGSMEVARDQGTRFTIRFAKLPVKERG
ncbi:MAG: PAS domain S-box protein [Methanomicrobiaceae archaeon]|nr:PAS domain S-box protein [Methanomicrobiaceae archaeon]